VCEPFARNSISFSYNKMFITCSMVQNIWASSCWKRLTLVRPLNVPDSSLRWRTPKSAIRSGSSRHERGRWSNIRLKK
jgi:hypothetical protein